MTARRLIVSFFLSVFVGLFPLMALWKNNLGQIAGEAVRPALLYTLLLIPAVFGVWLILTRLPEKSALLSCAVYGFVFSYGHLLNMVGQPTIFGISLGFVKLFAVCFSLLAAACLGLLRMKQVPRLSLFLFPAGALVLLNLFPVLRFTVQDRQPRPEVEPVVAAAAAVQPGQPDLPDIYFIVLDAYARADILRDVIGYDNRPFLAELEERGFYIPACAFSNYNGTVSALASILNYEMLDNLGVPANDQGTIQAVNSSLIHDSRAARVFRSYGYQFVAGRGYASFNDITSADVYLNYAINQGIEDDLAEQRFTNLYLNTTVFRVLTELYKNNPGQYRRLPFWLAVDPENDPDLAEANFWYLQNNFMFDALETFPDRPGRYFVYAHINAPHGPYVYRSDGSFRYPLDDQDETVRYADAVTYLNRRVLALVDELLKSTPAPIIIIQGDHGIHNLTTGLDKHKILSAYYLPGDLAVPPYPTITPVNNFRLILSNYFDPSVTLLPDTLWVKEVNAYEPIPAGCETP